MDAPLCGTNGQHNQSYLLKVGAMALTAGVIIGFASSTVSSWAATTVTTQPIVRTVSQVDYSSLRSSRIPTSTYDVDFSNAFEDTPTEETTQQFSKAPAAYLLGFGGLLAAGLAAFLSGSQKSQQQHHQPFDLESTSGSVWTMASSSGNLGAGKTVRVATRKSPLAMWQAEFIESELKRLWPGITVELQPMSTKGDKILDSPLAKVGGKGLFVKELENALLERRSDIAVHSTKDVPMELPDGLVLGIICKRHDPYDAIVFPKGSTLKSLDDLPKGARVGTSSLRRQCQLLLKRPDLQFLELRGNVNTRLAKLDSGDYDAIILAAAGLKRLGFSERVLPGETNIIDPNLMLPAAGQGALSIELRTDDALMAALLEPLHHVPDAVTVACERAMNRRLSGGCQVPISGFAVLRDGQLRMEARVGSVTGKGPLIIKDKTIPFALDKPWPELQQQSEKLGVEVADMLLAAGAQTYLDEAYAKPDVGVTAARQQ